MKQIKLKMLTVTALFLMIISGLITSCNKDEDFTDNTNVEMITQRFGLDILSTDLLKNDWNNDEWIVNLSTEETELTFTGVGHSHNTSITTSIQELMTEQGVFVDLVNGQEYDITFTTPHIRQNSTIEFPDIYFEDAFNNPAAPSLGVVVDIDVNTTEIITGNTVALPATLDDLLIVVDIAGVNTVRASNIDYGEVVPETGNDVIQLIRHNGNDGYQWGYFGMNDYERGSIAGYDGLHLYIRGADHTLLHKINASNFEKGVIYHIVEAGSVNPFPLNIPDFDIVQIII